MLNCCTDGCSIGCYNDGISLQKISPYACICVRSARIPI
nr:MAG TPA: hypothetical protein [Caudoviricetes sp.]